MLNIENIGRSQANMNAAKKRAANRAKTVRNKKSQKGGRKTLRNRRKH